MQKTSKKMQLNIKDYLSLVKSKDRVRDAGEVFTPNFLVEQMLDQFPPDAWGNKKDWLEPTCGNGQFIVGILKRKILNGSTLIEALDTTFGMDIMEDNIFECHQRIYIDVVMPYFRSKKYTAKKIKPMLWKIICIIENNIVKTEDSLQEDYNNKWRHFHFLPKREKEPIVYRVKEALSMVDGEIEPDNSKLYHKLLVFKKED